MKRVERRFSIGLDYGTRVTFCILALLIALAVSPAMSLAEDVAPNAASAAKPYPFATLRPIGVAD